MLFTPRTYLCIAFIAMVIAGCGSGAKVKEGGVEKQERDAATSEQKRQYSSEEIYKQFVQCRLPTNELVAKIGEPDFKGTGDQGETFWQYYDLQTSEEGDQIFNTNFVISDGAVTYSWVTQTRDAYEDSEE